MSLFKNERVFTETQVKEILRKWQKSHNTIKDHLTANTKDWWPVVKAIIKIQHRTLAVYFDIPYKDTDNDSK